MMYKAEVAVCSHSAQNTTLSEHHVQFLNAETRGT
jgi:hypothetical protein